MSQFKLKMVEIYRGKLPDWKGWHNLSLVRGEETHKAIAGPLDPETSNEIIAALLSEPSSLAKVAAIEVF